MFKPTKEIKMKYILFAIFILNFGVAKSQDLTDSVMVIKTIKASYYANKFEGRRTTSGQRYRHAKLTAAHRT